jgi:stearoyl-CoA desaturase (delta-9 desaturase)
MISRSTKSRFQILLVYAAFFYALYTSFTTGLWAVWLISIALFAVHSMFANHIALHRLFSHRSFTTTRPKEIFLALTTIFLGVSSPITYCAVHRAHHKHSDKPGDPHSAAQSGAWYVATAGWAFRTDQQRRDLKISIPKDLMRDPVLRFIETHFYEIWYALILGVFLLGGVDAVAYFLLAPVAIYLLAANVGTNLICHSNLLKSNYRNFDTDDNSHNSPIVQFFTMGEGYQNNHHHDCTTCSQAVKPGEYDPAAWIVRKFFATSMIEKN